MTTKILKYTVDISGFDIKNRPMYKIVWFDENGNQCKEESCIAHSFSAARRYAEDELDRIYNKYFQYIRNLSNVSE